MHKKNAADRAIDRILEPIFNLLREAPIILFIGLGAAGYWGWKQSTALDNVCYNLFAAFDDTARGPSYSFTLDFETTVELFERMPTLRNAAKKCHQMRDYMASYDVLGRS